MKLKNQRQEKFCQLWFAAQGTNTPVYECAISAGYALKAARQISSRLLTYANIQKRLAELSKKAEDASIMTVIERKQKLSDIARANLIDFQDSKGNIADLKGKPHNQAISEYSVTIIGDGENAAVIKKAVKLHDPVRAIDLLNKMERIYEPENNTTINILNVQAKDLTDDELADIARRSSPRIIEQKTSPPTSD
jgi:phage terminase small subunit